MPTSTAALLNVPNDQQQFDIWAFSLSQNLSDIQDALRSQRGTSLPSYPIYPVPSYQIGDWLQRVSQAVGDVCSALGIEASDVENVNLEDARERQAWSYTIYQELTRARQLLSI